MLDFYNLINFPLPSKKHNSRNKTLELKFPHSVFMKNLLIQLRAQYSLGQDEINHSSISQKSSQYPTAKSNARSLAHLDPSPKPYSPSSHRYLHPSSASTTRSALQSCAWTSSLLSAVPDPGTERLQF